MQILQQTHDILEIVECFQSIGIQYKSMFPVKVKTKPCIFIMRRKKDARDPIIGSRVTMSDGLPQHVIDEMDSVEIVDDGVPISDEIPSVEFHPEEVINNEPEPTVLVAVESVLESTETTSEEIENASSDTDAETDDVETKTAKIRPTKKKPKKKSKKIEPFRSTKAKIKEIIEMYYRERGTVVVADHTKSNEIEDHRVEEPSISEAVVEESSPIVVTPAVVKSPKSNIKKIIKEEQIRKLVDEISTLDLNEFCDLEVMDVKDCLKKIIDEYDSKSEMMGGHHHSKVEAGQHHVKTPNHEEEQRPSTSEEDGINIEYDEEEKDS